MAGTNISHLCLTICAYRNPELTEQEYHDYMAYKHAPLVKPLMDKYGILKYTMVGAIASIPPTYKSILYIKPDSHRPITPQTPGS
jgi:hypothetical protein